MARRAQAVVVAVSALFAWATPAQATVTSWGGFGDAEGLFNHPWDLALDGAGHVYVMDSGNFRVQKFTTSGAFLEAWGGEGSGDGEFAFDTHSLAVGPSGDVYVADSQASRIQQFDSDGTFVRDWGTSGAGDAQFSGGDLDVTVDSAGRVVVGDINNRRVQVFAADGAFVRAWGTAGTGDGQFSGVWPMSLATDADDRVYVYAGGRIQAFSIDGQFLRKWGRFGAGPGEFTDIVGLAVAPSGDIYASDGGTGRLFKFRPDGTLIFGAAATCPPGGMCAQWYGLDVGDAIYGADWQTSRIHRFSDADVQAGGVTPPTGGGGPGSGCAQPPAGPIGVSINHGARYTNKPRVRLRLVWPRCSATVLVSNDGGFGAARSLGVAANLKWRLDSSGPERLPKTVYVRFDGTAVNYTDDIILDETAPVVSSARLMSTPAAATAARTYRIRLRAKDRTSGVARVQTAARRGGPSAARRYSTRLRVRATRAPRFVRVRDRAGNWSRWRSLASAG
jgi:NHL repeat-containing protein